MTIVPEDHRVDIPRRPPLEGRLQDHLRLAERVRHLVPAALAMRLVRRRAARGWDREPGTRATAQRRLLAVVAGTHRAAEVDALARAAVLEDACIRELFLRPASLIRRRRVDGLDHLQAALGTGRGVLVSYCHLGPFQGASTAVLPSGRTPWIFAGAWAAAERTEAPDGLTRERWRGLLTRTGAHILLARPGALELGTTLLRRGDVVCMLFDVPGGTVTPWLGKPVALASGSARMACAADALIVPMHCWRDGTRAGSTFHSALDPRDHDGPEPLHHALAAVHEELVLARPETLESPLREGFWGDGALPGAWTRPPAG